MLGWAIGLTPCIAAEQVPTYDALVVINESTLNKFLQAIGPISGGGSFNNGRSNYVWTVKNPTIRIVKNASSFTADAEIHSGLLNYGTTAKGDVDVIYDNQKNIISVKIRKASFEVALDLFGNKIHVTDVDISTFYKPQFQFPGPQPLQNHFDVDLPDKTVKPIQIKTFVKKISLEPGRIVVGSNFAFSTVIPSPNKQ
ncbi:hypothetical protein EB093_03735 [bacterium]|nr:hypothetical protein [bacterium]